MTADERVPPVIAKLYKRWQKKIFANDRIDMYPPSEIAGAWRLAITRNGIEASLYVDPHRACYEYQFMLKADNYMRDTLKILRERVDDTTN